MSNCDYCNEYVDENPCDSGCLDGTKNEKGYCPHERDNGTWGVVHQICIEDRLSQQKQDSVM